MIGIFGGTFDPIHLGHMGAADYLISHFDFKEIRLVPCHIPPHRDEPHANTQQRIDMLKLATQDEPRFIIDDCEIKRHITSYTIETIHEIKTNFPDDSLVLIIGADSWQKFTTWHNYEEIFSLVNILIMNRPGVSKETPETLKNYFEMHLITDINHFEKVHHGQIYFADDTNFDVSATQVRELLIDKDPQAEELLLPSVYEYIIDHAIY